MSWTRLDDVWTDSPDLAELDHADRWHYLTMIQFCSKTGRLDGVLRMVDARRCSDVPSPEASIGNLLRAGLLLEVSGGYRVVKIDDHIPPPSVRRNAENSKIRMRRKRAHDAGIHDECLQASCPLAPPDVQITSAVTQPVTRNTGTGRDGTGQASTNHQNKQPSLHLIKPSQDMTEAEKDDAWNAGLIRAAT